MNIFIGYDHSDIEKVTKIEQTLSSIDDINTFFIKRKMCFWKAFAKAKIRKSNVMLLFIGGKSYINKNLMWEFYEAQKYGIKSIAITLKNNVIFPDWARPVAVINFNEEIDCNKIIRFCYSYIDVNIFNNKMRLNMDLEYRKLAMEQYKVLLNSSENLMSRRQQMNTFYMGFNGVCITAICASIKLGGENNISFFICSWLGILGIFLSAMWRTQINSYRTLNQAKYEIINNMEKNIFPSRAFIEEWNILEQAIKKGNYQTVTEIESKISIIFEVLYSFIIVGIYCYFIWH